MGHRRRRGTNALRLACLLALAAGLLATGSPGGALRIQPGASAGSLTSLTLTSVGSDGSAADAASAQAAIASGGRYVAFESQAALGVSASVQTNSHSLHNGSAPVSRIYVHDLVGGGTTLLSDPAGGDAEAPDISANGRLVSFEQRGNVYVADRQATGVGPFDTPANLVVRRVTGTPRDLEYEHAVSCPPDTGLNRVTPCRPHLSADGSTLVYAAELTPVSPELAVTATFGESAPARLPGDMLDFSAYDGDEVYGEPGGEATVGYRNTGGTPIAFGRAGVTVTEPPGTGQYPPFTLSGDTCTGTLGPGQSCAVDVTFQLETCSRYYLDQMRLVSGHLTTHASTPAGQSVLDLTAFCDFYELDGPAGPVGQSAVRQSADASQPVCPTPPTGLALAAAPVATIDNQGAALTDAGPTEIGRPYVLWTTITVPYYEGTSYVLLRTANGPDCQIRLVNPAKLGMKLADPLPKSAPPACYQGEPLGSEGGSGETPTDPRQECTAYLLVDPGQVAPDGAFLGTYEPTSNSPVVTVTSYLTEQGVRHVIVARRAPGGTGNFGASPSTVVSVTGTGAELPGAAEPSVSANGRYVGFAAPIPIGATGQQVAPGASEVWRHDTGKAGKAGDRPGATTLVSCLPRARAGPCLAAANADSPSVSGDGQLVAFATTAAPVPHNAYPGTGGYPGTGTDTAGVAGVAGVAGQVSADQVYLRSVAARTTVLISEPFIMKIHGGNRRGISERTPGNNPNNGGGNGPSYAPAITQDSSAVAYVSRATNLTAAQVPAGTANLYLRSVSPGVTANELASATGASLPAGTSVGLPSIDAHGRLVAFRATGALTAGAPPGIASIYTFGRLPSFAAPPAAGFGSVLIDSGTHARPVGVTDIGPGPGTVTGVQATAPFGVSGDRCIGVTLYQGSRCAVTLTFTPAKAGAATGVLTVTTQDDDEPPVIVSISATAAVPAPQLILSPGVASAGEASQVVGTDFPPDQTITLTWSLGLGSGAAMSSGTGTFGAAMVIFPNDFVGPRTLIASGNAGPLATAPFLVQDAPAEPPFSQQVP
jgi:hypothetical protein